jgi:hypothetical protein
MGIHPRHSERSDPAFSCARCLCRTAPTRQQPLVLDAFRNVSSLRSAVPHHVIPNGATRLFPAHVFCAPGRAERNLSSIVERGSDRSAQVIPLWIKRLNQGHFLRAAPALDFLLSRNCGPNAGVGFKPNELRHIVFLREAGNELFLVLKDSLGKLPRHPKVEHTRFASHEINVKSAVHKNRHSVTLWLPSRDRKRTPSPNTPTSFRTKRPGFFLRTSFVRRVAQRGISPLPFQCRDGVLRTIVAAMSRI